MSETPDAPAKFHAGHTQRVISPVAGAKKGWRNDHEHPLLLAYAKNQLQGGIIRDGKGNPKYTAADRLNAGNEFRRLWERFTKSGRDSTDLMRASSARSTLTDGQCDALDTLCKIWPGLNSTDRIIIQRVCGEGFWPSEAVREACGPGYIDATIPRLNEALDHLIEVFARVKRLDNLSGESVSNASS